MLVILKFISLYSSSTCFATSHVIIVTEWPLEISSLLFQRMRYSAPPSSLNDPCTTAIFNLEPSLNL